MNKSNVMFTDPFLGDITIQDFIYYLESLKRDNDILIDRLYTIIKNLNCYDDEDIASIFNGDISSSLKTTIDILESHLN